MAVVIPLMQVKHLLKTKHIIQNEQEYQSPIEDKNYLPTEERSPSPTPTSTEKNSYKYCSNYCR